MLVCSESVIIASADCRRLEEWEKKGMVLTADKASLEEELQEARERLAAEEAAQKDAAEKGESLQRELEILKVELTAARQNIEKAEFDKSKVSPAAPECTADVPASGSMDIQP